MLEHRDRVFFRHQDGAAALGQALDQRLGFRGLDSCADPGEPQNPPNSSQCDSPSAMLDMAQRLWEPRGASWRRQCLSWPLKSEERREKGRKSRWRGQGSPTVWRCERVGGGVTCRSMGLEPGVGEELERWAGVSWEGYGMSPSIPIRM